MIAPALVPPPYLPSDTTGGGRSMLSGSTGSASVGPAQEPPKPPKPPRTTPLVSPRRVAIAGGISALLVLALGAGLLLWLSWTAPARGRRDAGEEAANVRLAGFLRTGSERMLAGNPAGAAEAYAEAEKLKPGSEAIHKARVAAESKASADGQLAGMQKEKYDRIMEAQQALSARRWDDAVTAANAALVLDPTDVFAQQLLTAAQASQARAHAAPTTPRPPRKGQPEIAATVPAFEPTPAESRPAEPVSQISTLRVSFDSAVEGVVSVMVYAGKDKLLQQSVGERGGILRKGKAGHLDGSYQLAPGGVSLRVYVTPPGQKSLNQTLPATFLAGQSHHLEIRLSSDSKLEVALH
jgi:hypothetical protein